MNTEHSRAGVWDLRCPEVKHYNKKKVILCILQRVFLIKKWIFKLAHTDYSKENTNNIRQGCLEVKTITRERE